MRGLIQLYIGNGKGKTTAALGQAIRAVGAGKRVYLAQFLKNNRGNELKVLKGIKNITVADAPDSVPFFFQMTDGEKRQYIITENNTFDEAALNAPHYDMLILDEILDAVELNIISLNKLLGFISDKPDSLELVLTGHNDIPEVSELCDYVSEIKAVKHPFDTGTPAREGIEY